MGVFGIYPNFDWIPNSNAIVFYAKGKIRNRLNELVVSEIPF